METKDKPDEALVVRSETDVIPLGTMAPTDYGVQQGQIAPGLENVERDDIIVPVIRLIQGMSREATLENDDPDWRPMGTIVLGTTGITLRPMSKSADPIRFTPIVHHKSRSWFSDDRKRVAWSDDGKTHSPKAPPRDDGVTVCSKCPDGDWSRGPDGKDVPPNCGLQHVFVGIFPGHPEWGVAALICGSKSFRAGKQAVSIMSASNLPAYAYQFNLDAQREEGEKGTYYVWRIRPAGLNPKDGSVYARAENLYNEVLVGKTVLTDGEVDLEGESGAEPF